MRRGAFPFHPAQGEETGSDDETQADKPGGAAYQDSLDSEQGESRRDAKIPDGK